MIFVKISLVTKRVKKIYTILVILVRSYLSNPLFILPTGQGIMSVSNILRVITCNDLPPFSPNSTPIVYYICIILPDVYYYIEPCITVLVLDTSNTDRIIHALPMGANIHIARQSKPLVRKLVKDGSGVHGALVTLFIVARPQGGLLTSLRITAIMINTQLALIQLITY